MILIQSRYWKEKEKVTTMCERFSLTSELAEIENAFQIDKVMFHYKSRYNIAPTQHVPVIVRQRGETLLDEFRWGLIPFWAKDAIHAESETIHEKKVFRRLIGKTRCVIPCNGFYHWKKVGKSLQPVRFVMRNKGVFGMAGLYDIWRDPRGNETRTCTLVTTRSNGMLTDYTERMPVILDESSMQEWLTPGFHDKHFLQLLPPAFPADHLVAYPVSSAVSNVKNELPECIQEISWNYAMTKK
jgi:putative SOS response-associated peptidase YedK